MKVETYIYYILTDFLKNQKYFTRGKHKNERKNCIQFFLSPTGNIHQGHLHKGFPQERDGNHDKPEFGQPQEEILMLIIWK